MARILRTAFICWLATSCISCTDDSKLQSSEQSSLDPVTTDEARAKIAVCEFEYAINSAYNAQNLNPGSFDLLWDDARQTTLGQEQALCIPLKPQFTYYAAFRNADSYYEFARLRPQIVVCRGSSGVDVFVVSLIPDIPCAEEHLGKCLFHSDEAFSGYLLFQDTRGQFLRLSRYDGGKLTDDKLITRAESDCKALLPKNILLVPENIVPLSALDSRRIETRAGYVWIPEYNDPSLSYVDQLTISISNPFPTVGEDVYIRVSTSGPILTLQYIYFCMETGSHKVEEMISSGYGVTNKIKLTIPGRVSFRAECKINGRRIITVIPLYVNVQYPKIQDIAAKMNYNLWALWQTTINVTTKDYRRELGCWIYYNPNNNTYSLGTLIFGPQIPNSDHRERGTVTISPTPNEEDIDNGKIGVAIFHTHSILYYINDPGFRFVGPTDEDIANAARSGIPNLVYDYIPTTVIEEKNAIIHNPPNSPVELSAPTQLSIINPPERRVIR